MEPAERSWPEISAHIPRNLEGGETSRTERSLCHLRFKPGHIRFDQLRFGYAMSGLPFGSDTVIVGFAE